MFGCRQVAFVVVSHWVACVWFWIGSYEALYTSYTNIYTGGGKPWLQVFPGHNHTYQAADLRTKYTAALYWTITTMSTTGYGTRFCAFLHLCSSPPLFVLLSCSPLCLDPLHCRRIA